MSETARKLLPLLTKYGYVDARGSAPRENRFYGPCGYMFLNNIKEEWRRSFLSSAEVDVFPLQQNGIATSSSGRIGGELQLAECFQHTNASLKNVVDTKSTFGLICTTDQQNDQEDSVSCTKETELFTALALSSEMTILNGHFFCFFPHRTVNASLSRCFRHPTFWTRLQFALCTPSSKLFYWLTYWQRQRLVWWKRLSREPSGFSAVEMSRGMESAGVSIRRRFPWGDETIEHIGAIGSQSCGRNWIVCDASANVAAAVYLWDAIVAQEGSEKSVLALHHKLTPYKVTVAATLASLRPLADLLAVQLRKAGVATYANPFLNSGMALDDQIARFDEMGIQYAILLDRSTHKTGVTYVRHRDTTIKEEMHVTDVGKQLPRYLRVPEAAPT